MPHPADLERVLADDDWLRRIARRLAGDPEAAEDLAQDAWVAALSQGRRDRPWWSGVLRNLRRQEVRRAVRDEDARRGTKPLGEAPPTDDVAAELYLRKRVSEGLFELDEPYRTALYLRYVQDEKLPAIARKTGASVSTVHERLARGLQRLRLRLDEHYGGERRNWAVGLLTLAKPPGLATTLAGGIAVGASVKIAAATLVVGGAVAWMWSERGGAAAVGTEAAAPIAAASQADKPLPAPPQLPDLDGRERLAPKAAPLAESVPPPTNDPSPTTLRGRVVDLDNRPVPGVPIGYWPGADALTESGPMGYFEIPHDPDEGQPQLVCLRDDLVTALPGIPADDLVLVVVSPSVDLAGTVVDAEGHPIPGAELRLDLRQALFRDLGLPRPLTTLGVQRSVVADPTGRFRLDRVPGGPHVGLWVSADGFDIRAAEVPPTTDLALIIPLEARATQHRIEGVVLDQHGVAVEGASVSAGARIATTAGDGSFRLAVDRHHPDGLSGPIDRSGASAEGESAEPTITLRALFPGYLPAERILREPHFEEPVVLRLGPSSLKILGRIEDESGQPRPGALVWVTDLTPFGTQSQESGGARAVWDVTAEALGSGLMNSFGAVTDERGLFELPGLLQRSYQLRAYDPATATYGGPYAVSAGAHEALLILPSEARTDRVAGRVVNGSGDPISGVWIVPRRGQTFNDGSQPPHLPGVVMGTSTDDGGRFEFPALATVGTSLELQHESFFIRTVGLDPSDDLDDLTIVQAILCELQVELFTDPELGDRIKILDGEDRPLDVIESLGAFMTFDDTARLTDGKTGILRVSEQARVLALFKDGVEVLRQPLRLDPSRRTLERL